MRVLVVEDDPMTGRAMVAGLRGGGYVADWARDGAEAARALACGRYDLALLDLGLPRRDGLQVLQSMRGQGSELPVVIVSGRDALADRVSGLDGGADDYLVKPFDLNELLSRVRAVLRRNGSRGTPVLSCGALTLDPVRREVTFRGAPVALTAREFGVLEVLMREPGAVVSRERLMEVTCGWGEEVGSNTIDVHLHRLRRKLGPQVIRNVRGEGYRVAPVE